MDIYPVLFPACSNREDLLITVSVFDDDTGLPVSLHGTTGSGTFSFWNVTCGTVVTTSATTITIPALPLGNELSALSLTVGTNLAIQAGSMVQIADLSGNNTMTGYVLSYVPATGAMVCQIGVTYQCEIRFSGPRESGSGYVTWYDFGTPSTIGPILHASLGNGLLVVELGKLQILFPETQMRQLRQGTYQLALTMTDSVNTRQLFVARQPVIPGGVSQ